jgi:WG containing repeat
LKVLDTAKGFRPLFGYIDKTGKVVIKPQFSIVSQFNSGLAFVSYENGVGYINKTRNSVWEGKF